MIDVQDLYKLMICETCKCVFMPSLDEIESCIVRDKCSRCKGEGKS